MAHPRPDTAGFEGVELRIKWGQAVLKAYSLFGIELRHICAVGLVREETDPLDACSSRQGSRTAVRLSPNSAEPANRTTVAVQDPSARRHARLAVPIADPFEIRSEKTHLWAYAVARAQVVVRSIFLCLPRDGDD